MIIDTELEQKGNEFPNAVVHMRKEVDTLFFETENKVILELTILRDSVIRFRYGTRGNLQEDFSYAIDRQEVRGGYNELAITEDEEFYIVTTSKLVVKIEKKSLQTHILDKNGTIINEDEIGFHYEESFLYGGNIVKMSKKVQAGEGFYGMGDKPMHTNLRGKRMQNWSTDSYAFAKDQDPIYKSVPFYIGLNQKQAYGIFFDNTFKSHFDFCQERLDVASFWAEGGEMNYYFIYGPSMSEVVQNYTHLTGKPDMPPLWTLGFQQCKWSYYPEARVKEITNTFRELKIPCDGIYLDIDYMEGFRCFTWNKEYFPDPKRMVKELADDGFKTIVIIDPGIKLDPDYWVYNEALENDYFCKRADGPPMIGKVWPGECAFPDYTNPDVREWWAGLFQELIEDIGVKGVWNDMNEPAVMEVPGKTFPDDVRHNYDGHPCSHRKAHNIYGTQMARATYEGVKRFIYPKRPFVITRSAYSGAQRYTSSWTGDNVATWEHLWVANIQVQRMCISGMSFTGTDIGGFAEQPTGELFARWIQLGVFHPFCRVHSSGHHGDQEPWAFGDEVTDISRKFIEIRYTLLPYLYTMFYDYSTKAVPMLKPLVYYDQEDTHTHYRTDEFIFGEKILVCPITEPNARGRRMYLARGRWYNFWDHSIVEGGKELWVDADIAFMPIFIKEGAMIPRYPVQQYVGEKSIEELVIETFYKEGIERSSVYEDAQDGYDYKKGRYSLREFKLTGKEQEVIIQQHKTGTFITDYEYLMLKFIGFPFEVKKIEIDNVAYNLNELDYDVEKKWLKVTKEFTEIHILG
ncbi:glycoside hydrolase family 31 protein [Flavimarina sp. Hel_I_48]|uniref:glycoside hydrolase family 31 protein n=1 Tax=Flavimarina sp. Hel_I_48 TaxID=1392488 RepID=UPI0004DF3D85|nr:glycoside hydrolase family 31 protein [Flavimarina sp. Hel_I_48]